MNYYNEYDRNFLYRRDDFEKRNVCFLVLAAVVMKSDSIIINHAELNFIKQLFLKKYSERIAKAYILKLRDVLKEEKYDMDFTFELFRRYTNYIDHKATIRTLFELASIDGEIGIPEFLALWDIGQKLGIATNDMSSVLNRYRSKVTRRIEFKIEFGRLHFYFVNLEEDSIANDSEENSIVKKAYRLLGIDENATDDEVKEAYRKMVKNYHPDLCGDNQKEQCEKMMKKLNEARETIMRHREISKSKCERG